MIAKSSKVKIAVIGVGLIGPRHCRTIITSSDATLTAIVDPLRQGAKLAEELGTKHYKSIQDLLMSPEKPDAAIVCTPNQTHVPIAKELADAGIHVLVEKPISPDVESGRDLVNHTQKTRTHVLIGHHRRHNPYIAVARNAVASGSLGDIIAVNGLWALFKPVDYFEAPTEWRKGKNGGVVLINFIHEIDLLHHLFGPIVRVHAEQMKRMRGYEVEEGAAITLKFLSGTVGTFLFSDNLPSPYSFEAGTGENPLIPKVGASFYHIFGTNASLSIPDMTRWSYDGVVKSWHEPITQRRLEVKESVPFELQLAHFVRVCRGEEQPSCTAEDGLAALIVCNAVKRAIQTGDTVDIDELKGRTFGSSI
ncbi:Gfo/Idh/MocA family protein [Aspergillus tanneri]|uniref:Gfo/Idh/MocA-like oxidoreductase N-terminal domain-containing protein n=1 Tax=Aspergillus tanneri TaxID=1220188 RepID=A0A5M9ML98_9EURO|nr:uncharacterized protein ATNIH1004_005361 [Aspergillus tanneri]KAA8646686.1 hypothetical protein ATNIH1004_005361 [Aspergillus tanneri]